MKFVDEVNITVQSGHGGGGCVSFRRERFVPKGGPDGGDGGHGGDIIFRSSRKKRTLYHLNFNNQFVAGNGLNGQGAKKTGRSGRDLVIDVPIGTEIINPNTGQVLKDLVENNSFFIAAKGGRGGLGNTKFKSSTNRVPKFSQPGEAGSVVTLRLELKLLADVGIIGLPNVGKSTLLSVISAAKPKIGDYPFTTLVPNLGIVNLERIDPFVVADIPGLIKGAHKGSGLGIQFLKHIERTNIIIHMVDATKISHDSPFDDVKIIEEEITSYSKKLSNKPRLFILNKIDMPLNDKAVQLFKKVCKLNNFDTLCISALTGKGIKNLVLKMSEMLTSLAIS